MSDDNELPDHTSFAVVLTPSFGSNGRWDGRVEVHMEEDDLHDLDDEELLQMRTVCGMMAASLTWMEENQEFNEFMQDYFLKHYRSFIEDTVEGVLELDEERKPNLTRSEDGKVITLDFSSKTYGEA